jgi:hypothetical protein
MAEIIKELAKRNLRTNRQGLFTSLCYFLTGITGLLTFATAGERFVDGNEHVFSPFYRFYRAQRNILFNVPPTNETKSSRNIRFDLYEKEQLNKDTL